tara:strand:- start:71 stop:268 length:198 start_codon:yes stop_codon:yes gene_type:complete
MRIKFFILKVLGKRPLLLEDAARMYESEYVPGMGVYASDGVYFDLWEVVRRDGYHPMWKYGTHVY